MKEAEFQTRFGRWLKKNPDIFSSSCAFELKLVKGMDRCLSLKAVKEHQELGLRMVEQEGLYTKLTDLSLGLKPFDCLWLRNARGYVVIGFWEESGKGVQAFFIRVEEWDKLKAVALYNGRRSVGRKVLESIAERVERIK